MRPLSRSNTENMEPNLSGKPYVPASSASSPRPTSALDGGWPSLTTKGTPDLPFTILDLRNWPLIVPTEDYNPFCVWIHNQLKCSNGKCTGFGTSQKTVCIWLICLLSRVCCWEYQVEKIYSSLQPLEIAHTRSLSTAPSRNPEYQEDGHVYDNQIIEPQKWKRTTMLLQTQMTLYSDWDRYDCNLVRILKPLTSSQWFQFSSVTTVINGSRLCHRRGSNAKVAQKINNASFQWHVWPFFHPNTELNGDHDISHCVL